MKTADNSRRNFVRQAGLVALGSLVAPKIWAAADKEITFAARKFFSRVHPTFTSPSSPIPSTLLQTLGRYLEFASPDVELPDFQAQKWQIGLKGNGSPSQEIALVDWLAQFSLETRTYPLTGLNRWTYRVPWTGIPLAPVIESLDLPAHTTHLRFSSALSPSLLTKDATDATSVAEVITLADARHPLAFLAVGMDDQPLDVANGGPVRLILPWKYSYKCVPAVCGLEFLRGNERGFWETLNPEEYDAVGNVDPGRYHPRHALVEADEVFGSAQNVQLLNGFQSYFP